MVVVIATNVTGSNQTMVSVDVESLHVDSLCAYLNWLYSPGRYLVKSQNERS